MDKVRLMYDMARLAFETDSTRFVTLLLDSVNSPAIEIDGRRTSPTATTTCRTTASRRRSWRS